MNTRGSVAIVLAGGKSSRMGTPKPWLRWGDEFLLQRIVRIVGDAGGNRGIDPVVLVAHQGLARQLQENAFVVGRRRRRGGGHGLIITILA